MQTRKEDQHFLLQKGRKKKKTILVLTRRWENVNFQNSDMFCCFAENQHFAKHKYKYISNKSI